MAMQLQDIGQTIGNAISNIGSYSAGAAARANGVSATAQNAQGQFNQGSANNANMIGDMRTQQQYGFNAAQAAMANQFNAEQWDRTASWNEMMWERMAEFNHNEAKIQREWQQKMMETAYQRAAADMKAAGLNPILAATQGINPSTGSGATASVGGVSMSSAQANMASGGLQNGIAASESNYTGQMEYLSGTLGLISAVIGGMSSAMQGLGSLGDMGRGLGEALGDILNPPEGGSDTHKGSSGTEHGGKSGSYDLGKKILPGLYWKDPRERLADYFKYK